MAMHLAYCSGDGLSRWQALARQIQDRAGLPYRALQKQISGILDVRLASGSSSFERFSMSSRPDLFQRAWLKAYAEHVGEGVPNRRSTASTHGRARVD
jgi:hypothetical protein